MAAWLENRWWEIWLLSPNKTAAGSWGKYGWRRRLLAAASGSILISRSSWQNPRKILDHCNRFICVKRARERCYCNHHCDGMDGHMNMNKVSIYCRTANVRVAPNIRFIRALCNARIIDAANISSTQCAMRTALFKWTHACARKIDAANKPFNPDRAKIETREYIVFYSSS